MARLINRSQVSSAVGSKLQKPVNHFLRDFSFPSYSPEVVRRVHPYLHHAYQHPDNRSLHVRIRIRVRARCALLSLVLSGQDVQRGLIMPKREMRILIAQLGQMQVWGMRKRRWSIRVRWDQGLESLGNTKRISSAKKLK